MYGCDPNGKRIREYAQFIGQEVELLHYKLNYPIPLVLSGGFTDLRFPDTSEAMMMENLLRDLGHKFEVIREEKSITTIQNIRFTLDLWNEVVYAPDKVATLAPAPEAYICDEKRTFKVGYIAKVLTGGTKVPTIGFDFHRTPKERVRIIAGTMKDIAAVHSRHLENIFTLQRAREIGIA